MVNDFLTLHDLSLKPRLPKWKTITKICPVCDGEFKTKKDHPREKITCSISCANTHFRSGEDNPNYKKYSQNNYRRICFQHHKKECIICGETNVVAAHYFDENHSNNNPENLIPVCPTHHVYLHTIKLKPLIFNRVLEYRKSFINQ